MKTNLVVLFSVWALHALGQEPVASFELSAQSICVGSSVQFTDSSQNNPTSWEWHFDGGTPSVAYGNTPSVEFDSSGTFAVTLIASNSYGSDTLIVSNFIAVHALPEFSISPLNDTTICLGQSIHLGISANDTLATYWTPGSWFGNDSVFTPSFTTTYTAVGTDAYGCS